MTNTGIPRLCGGTVFTLILEARQQRYGVREHFAGDSDGLSEMDTLIGLAQVMVPDLKRPAKTREDMQDCRRQRILSFQQQAV